MELTMIRGLYQYHWWANRRLFEVASALGEDVAREELGSQFSMPTLKGMFAHVLAADSIWLARFNGEKTSGLLSDADFPSMADLGKRRDEFEQVHRRYIDGLTAGDLAEVIHYRDSRGHPYWAPLWQLLQHVANHGTHHRSEIATMLTIRSGSPPSTDLLRYQRETSGQV
jgi:uncharacterized damage-inducible protein DinB